MAVERFTSKIDAWILRLLIALSAADIAGIVAVAGCVRTISVDNMLIGSSR